MPISNEALLRVRVAGAKKPIRLPAAFCLPLELSFRQASGQPSNQEFRKLINVLLAFALPIERRLLSRVSRLPRKEHLPHFGSVVP